MWIFAILVLGVLATGIVFAVNESLRLAGLRGFAGASSGRMIAEVDGCAGLGRPVCLSSFSKAMMMVGSYIKMPGYLLSRRDGLLRYRLLAVEDLLPFGFFAFVYLSA